MNKLNGTKGKSQHFCHQVKEQQCTDLTKIQVLAVRIYNYILHVYGSTACNCIKAAMELIQIDSIAKFHKITQF